MESPRATQFGALVTGRRYRLLTLAATGTAVASAVHRMRLHPPLDSLGLIMQLFGKELLSSHISATIVLHAFLLSTYSAFLLLARVALGSLRPLELQQTKETILPFVMLRCQLLVSTMKPSGLEQKMEICVLVVWLTALAVLRALLVLTQARFQYQMTRPMTQFRDLQRLGAVLGGIIVFNLGLAATCGRLGHFPVHIMHVPWFEASLMLLKTLELGVQVGYQSLDVHASSCSMKEETEMSENNELHLLLLQTVLCGCYLVQLVLYYLYVIRVDQFRVSLFDLILILNVKNATMRLLNKVKHVKLYHYVVLDLDHLFKDATPEELASVADDVCAICLKGMSTQAKKLECGHLYHRLCLRQCLQKASVSETLVGLDPLTSMVNGLSIEGIGRTTAFRTTATSSTSLRCPICRKQVCGDKSMARTVSEEHRRRLVAARPEEPHEAQGIPIGAATGPVVAPEEVIRFSTAFLPRWVPFPHFSFEIVRHRRGQRIVEVTQAMVQQIYEVFPQYTLDEIRADLVRTHSAERTMERILNGRLEAQRLALEQQSPDRSVMDSSGVLGDAVIDLGEDFRWSLSTLASALWGLNPSVPTDSARPRQEDEIATDIGTNAPSETTT